MTIEEKMTMNGKKVRVGVSLLVGNMDNMVRFYRDILGFHTQWDGGPFADFETGSGDLSLFMYSREEFVKAIGEDYIPPRGINQTFEIALWQSWVCNSQQENLLPILSASATFM